MTKDEKNKTGNAAEAVDPKSTAPKTDAPEIEIEADRKMYIICPSCRAAYEGTPVMAGQETTCMACNHTFVIDELFYDVPPDANLIELAEPLQVRADGTVLVEDNENPNAQLCPFCREVIQLGAEKCPHCHTRIADELHPGWITLMWLTPLFIPILGVFPVVIAALIFFFAWRVRWPRTAAALHKHALMILIVWMIIVIAMYVAGLCGVRFCPMQKCCKSMMPPCCSMQTTLPPSPPPAPVAP